MDFRLLQPLDYTAILAFNDVLAYHAVTALYFAAGIAVPDAISVVGIDHIRWHNTYLPPMTSITVDGQSVAETAVEMLFDRISNPEIPFRHRVLPVRLHENGTTRAIQPAP